MTNEHPEALGEILARLFTARGWGRRQERLRWQRLWADVAGPALAEHSRVLGFRRGIFDVEVETPILLQEIVGFHKPRLTKALRDVLPQFRELRLRAGNQMA